MRNYNDMFIEDFLKRKLRPGKVPNQGRLLDLGCGSLPYAHLYKPYFADCISGDYTKRSPYINLVLDAQSLPFRSDSFDAVIFCEVIEHIPDAEKALYEISRILKPGGVLFITWPYHYMIHEAPNDYVRYSEFGMSRIMAACELEIEEIYRRGNAVNLFLIILEFFVAGFFEIFVRIPIFGNVLRKLKTAAIALIFRAPMVLYFSWFSNRIFQRSCQVGSGMNGWLGHLNHWTLGYCAVVRKTA